MPTPPGRPLSRTCRLADFSRCASPAAWQEHLAWHSYERWLTHTTPSVDARIVALNWSNSPFVAPGPTPIYLTQTLPHDDTPLAAVFALSVLDRIDAPLRFLLQARARLIPGGLLYCAFAYWDADGPDCATGAELRRRLYNRRGLERLLHDLRRADLPVLDGIDWSYGGHALGDHTLMTLVLTSGAIG